MESVEEVGDVFADFPHPRLDHAVVDSHERQTVYWAEQDEIPPPEGPTPGNSVPSGWLAVELEHDFAVPEQLADAALIDAIVGYGRIAAWAQAKQAALIAELGARRPADDADAVQRNAACAVSRFAADELGVALHLSRGGRCCAWITPSPWPAGCRRLGPCGSGACWMSRR